MFHIYNSHITGKSKAEGSNNSFSIRRDIWNLLPTLSSLYALVLLEVSKQIFLCVLWYIFTFHFVMRLLMMNKELSIKIIAHKKKSSKRKFSQHFRP